MKIRREMAQASRQDENTLLHKKSYPVNMRLYKSSSSYYNIISTVINNMIELLKMEFEDYKKLKGISAPNIGIPLRIIAVSKLRLRPRRVEHIVMINPEIVEEGDHRYRTRSACGSVRHKGLVPKMRRNFVRIKYIKENGRTITQGFYMDLAPTIQHEIDHLNGKLITDRR